MPARERFARRRMEVVGDRRGEPAWAPSRAVANELAVAPPSRARRPRGRAWSDGSRLAIVRRGLIRLHHHSEFPLELLLERKREPVTVVLPTREVADTIAPIVERLLGLRGLVDQVLVVDAASEDGTAELARQAGAEAHQEAELMPELGPPLGKGDAMWRALSVARGELIAYLDSDTRRFSAHFATGMLAARDRQRAPHGVSLADAGPNSGISSDSS